MRLEVVVEDSTPKLLLIDIHNLQSHPIRSKVIIMERHAVLRLDS